jgi:hypothetical protein
MRTAVRLLLIVTVLAASDRLDAQHLRVGISVHETGTRGVFQSGFAAALRALGDVDVMTPMEEADYVLEAVVLCSPNPCERATRYAVAIRVFEPAHRSTAEFLAQLALHPKSTVTVRDPATDSLTSSIWAAIKDRELTFTTRVAEWLRESYQQSLQELVAELDSRCFDKLRAFRRFLADRTRPLSDRHARFQEYAEGRDWIC